ncbi:ATP-dependent RecD-like DNA helicase [Aureivirga sp. CE67]|uniref:ATP-dependent DNA helicase n=1 Tax=Aureivirga sp. CE67 TaxID=1788983 RepID=UPI0018C9CE88|nr:DEAD/DEAH box helicase [Aureivirga sp. CE67]
MEAAFTFSEDKKEIIDLVENTDKHLFITGKAGTGKSTLLKYICERNKDIVVLAPTGIAAINVNGDTIHSFFRLKPGYELDEAKNVRVNRFLIEKLKAVDTILIDEISMVRADILDAIDVLLRKARRSQADFGGVRMLFFGDLFQLPPVVNEETESNYFQKYDSPYFFSAHVFQQKDLFTPAFQLEIKELNKVFRQTDLDFIEVLNKIRLGEITNSDLDFMNQRVQKNFIPNSDKPYIHLVSTNQIANSINNKKLNEISDTLIQYKATKHGEIGSLQPNNPLILLKVGAQVMFIQNDVKKRWVNGTIGIITKHEVIFDKEEEEYLDVVFVKLENGKEVEVRPFTWEISKYTFENGRFQRINLGYYTQIPLKLAWAVTIHKSQGKSFQNAIIDLGSGSFAHGQTYVALSRCRSFEGLVLKQEIQHSDIIVDEIVVDFLNH